MMIKMLKTFLKFTCLTNQVEIKGHELTLYKDDNVTTILVYKLIMMNSNNGIQSHN